jgi:hypothetical protein
MEAITGAGRTPAMFGVASILAAGGATVSDDNEGFSRPPAFGRAFFRAADYA